MASVKIGSRKGGRALRATAYRKVDAATVARLVRKWQKRLGLDHWSIDVEITSDMPDHTYATTSRMASALRARINVNRTAFETPSADTVDFPDLERTILHELGHVLVGHLSATVENVLDDYYGGTLGRALRDRIEVEEEKMVDALSIALMENWK